MKLHALLLSNHAVWAAPQQEATCVKGCLAGLQASQEEGQRLQQEVSTLQEELTRVRTVASRATSREVAGGSKEAGVIPVPVYLEEVTHCFVKLP